MNYLVTRAACNSSINTCCQIKIESLSNLLWYPRYACQDLLYVFQRKKLLYYPGGSRIIVFYTHARPKKHEKGLFFEAERDWHETRLGVKMCQFLKKRVIFDSIKGCLWVIFQTLPKMSSKKACLGVNFGAKLCEILD